MKLYTVLFYLCKNVDKYTNKVDKNSEFCELLLSIPHAKKAASQQSVKSGVRSKKKLQKTQTSIAITKQNGYSFSILTSRPTGAPV